MGIATLRYTFPLWDMQSTSAIVPVFFHRMSLGLVAQAALADEGQVASFRASEGIELFQDLEVAHIFPILLRAGVYTGQGSRRDLVDFVVSIATTF